MDFPGPLIRATLIKRYKRFLADCTLEDGTMVTAHCANPGSMMGLNTPGLTVHLSHSDDPRRKLKYSLQLVEIPGNSGPVLVAINTGNPNKIAEEAIRQGTVTELAGYASLRREVKYGRNSRIDLLLSDADLADDTARKPDCYVEIKNVHLLRHGSLAEFPDSVTTRGAKHLEELADMVAQGHRAIMFYIVQRPDCDCFALAHDLDPGYAAAFARATARGVEAMAYVCHVGLNGVVLDRRIPIAPLPAMPQDPVPQ
jgi:sugar fermentation stimulation protein A